MFIRSNNSIFYSHTKKHFFLFSISTLSLSNNNKTGTLLQTMFLVWTRQVLLPLLLRATCPHPSSVPRPPHSPPPDPCAAPLAGSSTLPPSTTAPRLPAPLKSSSSQRLLIKLTLQFFINGNFQISRSFTGRLYFRVENNSYKNIRNVW